MLTELFASVGMPAGRGEQVLAWARAAWDDSCERLPVLVGFDPAELEQD